MKVFNVNIAGRIIEIKAFYQGVDILCQEFKTDRGPADFSVQCSLEDFEYEAEQYVADRRNAAPGPIFLEEYAVLKKVSEGLIDFGAFLMHGAAIAVDDKGIVFTAPSGTGKTTHVIKWLRKYPGTYMVNGDKPFILTAKDDRPVMVCGSPWAGKEDLGSNTMVPLKAIVLMERAEENTIKKVSFSEAFISLYPQIYRPMDPEKMRKTLRMIQSLDGQISFYRFYFNNLKEDCFQVAYEAIMER